MYFIIFKGSLGREVYLTDLEGVSLIQKSFTDQKDYSFINYNPLDLEDCSHVMKKHGTVYSFEVKQERGGTKQ